MKTSLIALLLVLISGCATLPKPVTYPQSKVPNIGISGPQAVIGPLAPNTPDKDVTIIIVEE